MIQVNYKLTCYLKPEEIQRRNVSGLYAAKYRFKDLCIAKCMHIKKWELESKANFNKDD